MYYGHTYNSTNAKVQSSKARAWARSFRSAINIIEQASLAPSACQSLTISRKHHHQELILITLLHVHRDFPIDIAAAVDEFSRRHPRRMQSGNDSESGRGTNILCALTRTQYFNTLSTPYRQSWIRPGTSTPTGPPTVGHAVG